MSRIDTPVLVADRLVASYINGNRKAVIDELAEMSALDAATVAFAMAEVMPDERDRVMMLGLLEARGR